MISVLTAPRGTRTAAKIFGFRFKDATAVTFAGTGVTATVLPGGTDTVLPIFIDVDSGASLGDHPFTVTAANGTSAPHGGFTVVDAVAGNVISTAAGIICCSFTGGGGPAITTSLSFPGGIAADRAGNIYFAESHRIRRINPFGILDDVAGTGFSGYSGDGGLATTATLSNPGDVAVDHAGNIYVSDYGNMRVRKVSTSGIITTIAGNGTSGTAGDGGLATAAQLLSPTSVAVDAAGNVFIGDWNRLRKVQFNRRFFGYGE